MTAAKQAYSHTEVLSLEVIRAFDAKVGRKGSYAKASRVVSGLLKAAAKRNEVGKRTSWGRVTGTSVFYEMTEEQVNSIRAQAIARAI